MKAWTTVCQEAHLVQVQRAKGTVWSLLLATSRMERSGSLNRFVGIVSSLLSCRKVMKHYKKSKNNKIIWIPLLWPVGKFKLNFQGQCNEIFSQVFIFCIFLWVFSHMFPISIAVCVTNSAEWKICWPCPSGSVADPDNFKINVFKIE